MQVVKLYQTLGILCSGLSKTVIRKEGNEKEWRGGKWDGVKCKTIR